MIYFIALLTGVTIVIAMVQNSRLSHTIGITQTTLMNYITGLTAVLILFFLLGESWRFIFEFSDTHYLAFWGGLLGIIVVTSSTLVLKKISMITATMLMYSGQLLMGLLIDWFRGTELSYMKVVGCFIIILGVYLNAKVDMRSSRLENI